MKKYIFVSSIFIFLIIAIICLAMKKSEETTGESSPISTAPDTLAAQQNESKILSVIKSPSSVGEVTFAHELHFDDLEIECETCHHEVNAAKLQIPHEDYFEDFWIDCKVCHHKSGEAVLEAQACSNCHKTNPSNIADETLSSKVVIHKSCWECHEVATGAEASQNCKMCHSSSPTKLQQKSQ